MIRVAQAGSDERYTYNGGAAGDQRKTAPDKNGCFTGELNIMAWYNKPWDYLIRPNSTTIAEAMARTAEKICKNKNVGYDQSQDETLWDALERLGWKESSIDKLPLCETDCCRLVDVEIRMAGVLSIPDLRHKYTGNIRKALEDSGLFTVYKETVMTQTTDFLRRGDLLLQEGHHIVTVLDTQTTTGKGYRISNCLACCLRSSGSTKGKILTYLHSGDPVILYGWSATGWGKVTTPDGLAGFVSPKYLVSTDRIKTTGKVWLRSGAGTKNQALTVIPNNTTLAWGGQTAKDGNITWYATNFGGYTGFVSGKYISVLKA